MRRPRIELAAAAFLLLLESPLSAGEPKPTPKPDDRPHVTLSWSTASEVDNFGYFVMRGDDEKGPFKQLNEKAIPGAINSEVPRDYKYVDFAVTPGKVYWYFLEAVSTSGVREKFSPVLKRQCCKQTAAPRPGGSEPGAEKKNAP